MTEATTVGNRAHHADILRNPDLWPGNGDLQGVIETPKGSSNDIGRGRISADRNLLPARLNGKVATSVVLSRFN
jgi:hypothetical protein